MGLDLMYRKYPDEIYEDFFYKNRKKLAKKARLLYNTCNEQNVKKYTIILLEKGEALDEFAL